MTAQANLYYLGEAPPLQGILDTSGFRGMVLARREDGEPGRIMVLVGGARVELAAVAREELASHLEGLSTYLAGRCEVSDPALPERMKGARGALAVTIEPGFDAAGACDRFLSALAARTDGVLLNEDGSLEDAGGALLAKPVRGAAGEEPERAGEEGEAEGSAQSVLQPPTQPRVVQRGLVLAALAWRGWLEIQRPADAEAQVEACNAWLERQGLFAEAEEREQELLRAPLGRWTERDVVDQGWAMEGAGVLAWALQLYDLPAHDVKVETPLLCAALGLFAPEPVAFGAELLPPDEIARLAAQLRGIHWRLHEFARAPGSLDFAAYARQAHFGGFDVAGIPMANGDLALGGEPLSKAPERAAQVALSIAMERHRAAAWLMAVSPRWAELDFAARGAEAEGEGAPHEQ